MKELLPLKLEGQGSADVEALPSFLYRLSYVHRFSVGEFVRALQRCAVRDGVVNEDFQTKHFLPRELVRPGKLTNRIRLLLDTYTDQDIGQSYLWILGKTLGVSNGETVKHVRWCPECFDEMRRLGAACYWKLVWFMNSVDCCPTHRISLVSKCNKCGENQDTFVRLRPISYCQNCGSDLVKQINPNSFKGLKPSWKALGIDVVKLLDDCSKADPEDVRQNGAWLSIKEILDYLYEEGREAELYGSMTRDEILALRFRQRPISLLSARRIAYRLGISLFDFLAGNGARVTRTLNGEYFCILPPGFLEATPKTKKDHKAYFRKAKRFLDTCDAPPTVAAVAAHLQVSKGFLEYRYIQLVEKIVLERSEFKTRQKLVLRGRATSEALNFFLGIGYSPVRFSKREANKVIRDRTGIPKSIVEPAVDVAFSALQVEVS